MGRRPGPAGAVLVPEADLLLEELRELAGDVFVACVDGGYRVSVFIDGQAERVGWSDRSLERALRKSLRRVQETMA